MPSKKKVSQPVEISTAVVVETASPSIIPSSLTHLQSEIEKMQQRKIRQDKIYATNKAIEESLPISEILTYLPSMDNLNTILTMCEKRVIDKNQEDVNISNTHLYWRFTTANYHLDWVVYWKDVPKTKLISSKDQIIEELRQIPKKFQHIFVRVSNTIKFLKENSLRDDYFEYFYTHPISNYGPSFSLFQYIDYDFFVLGKYMSLSEVARNNLSKLMTIINDARVFCDFLDKNGLKEIVFLPLYLYLDESGDWACKWIDITKPCDDPNLVYISFQPGKIWGRIYRLFEAANEISAILSEAIETRKRQVEKAISEYYVIEETSTSSP